MLGQLLTTSKSKSVAKSSTNNTVTGYVWTDLSLGGDKSALLDDCLAADVSEAGGADVSYLPPILVLAETLSYFTTHRTSIPRSQTQHHLQNQVALKVVTLSLYGAITYSLTPMERRRFAQVSHEYLIEQVQFTQRTFSKWRKHTTRTPLQPPCKRTCWTVNDGTTDITVNDALLQLGHDRFKRREGKCFTKVKIPPRSGADDQGQN